MNFRNRRILTTSTYGCRHDLTNFLEISQRPIIAMSFVDDYNEMIGMMRDEFAWHSKLLTNRLRFISLFVVINEMTKSSRNFTALKARRIGQLLCYRKRGSNFVSLYFFPNQHHLYIIF